MDCDVAGYHVQSFNYLSNEGVNRAAVDVPAEKFRLPNNDAIEIRLVGAQLDRPILEGASKLKTRVSMGKLDATKMYPSECRQRQLTYSAKLRLGYEVKVNGRQLDAIETVMGEVPIMLMSNKCNLKGLSDKQMIIHGEEPNEHGGYFVCKGNEKENHSASVLTLHYLDSGTMTLCFQFRKEQFYVPLMYVLKALVDQNDRRIYKQLLRGTGREDQFWNGCVLNMLHAAREDGIRTQMEALRALGGRFRVALSDRIAPWEPDSELGIFLMRYCIAIHLDQDGKAKFLLLGYMARKLAALVKGECAAESPDNPQFQEAAVSGHLLLMLIREKLETHLTGVRKHLVFAAQKKLDTFTVTTESLLTAIRARTHDFSHSLEYWLATGNLVTRSGLALQQTTGFSVMAERINQLRFVSHFRAIHRGAFFTTMRTTDVRKLRPEAFGFICPVHTPDGAPCGLLNHLTASCHIVTHYADRTGLLSLLSELGLISHSTFELANSDNDFLYCVLVDGRFVGFVGQSRAVQMARRLRMLKIKSGERRLSPMSEITLIEKSTDPKNVLTQYPGLFVFTEPARFVRPIRNILADCTEFIGTFEQVYLSICIDPCESEPGVTIHQELAPNSLFSFSANLIPFPDHNQSPRNVYQCQMGKQTMGFPVYAWRYRVDNKMYRLQTPQSPLVKMEAYDKYKMDDHPMGTNAIVAVISYTGYDMEDAMIINKSSFERGFGHGVVIKVDRSPQFWAYCGIVRVVTEPDSRDPMQHVLIQWHISRNPIIGDKFASRHGQKGINSFLWPAESLPFSETGMVPDILFNPHGFPSRMTIGMMLESMAGKVGATHAWIQDSTPFVFNEKNTAIDHFGRLLESAGFNYYGNETMYSGVDGREFQVEIFMGIVYYQRLRHMIADKFQVRATGPVDPVTHQPVKGRKKGGGVRFGEMERDALVGHGAAFALLDRLFHCSDRDSAPICTTCHSLLSVHFSTTSDMGNNDGIADHTRRLCCRLCGRDSTVQMVEIPRVFRYLCAELAAMNIKVHLDTVNYQQVVRL